MLYASLHETGLMQDLDITFKCYEWPNRIVKIMKDAVTKSTTDHKVFEQQLKAHRKVFGDSLGDLEQRVLAFDMYDVIARRAEHAREVRGININTPSQIHLLTWSGEPICIPIFACRLECYDCSGIRFDV